MATKNLNTFDINIIKENLLTLQDFETYANNCDVNTEDVNREIKERYVYYIYKKGKVLYEGPNVPMEYYENIDGCDYIVKDVLIEKVDLNQEIREQQKERKNARIERAKDQYKHDLITAVVKSGVNADKAFYTVNTVIHTLGNKHTEYINSIIMFLEYFDTMTLLGEHLVISAAREFDLKE